MSCSRCRENFSRLCECGAPVRVFDATCAACGERLEHPVWSPWPGIRRQAKRGTRAALVTLLIAGLPTAFLLNRYARDHEVPYWKIGTRIDTLATEEVPDWQEIRVLSRQLVDLQPDNARGWYLLALSGRRLGYHPRLAIREARKAVRLSPGLGEAQLFLAIELAGLHEYDEARVHVARAMEWSLAPAATWMLAGELELARVRPDVEQALAYFEEARRRGLSNDTIDVRSAILRQRLVGVVAPKRYPPELTVALQRAHAALGREEEDGDAPEGLREWFEAELAFAEGRMRQAEVAVKVGLRAVSGPNGDPKVRARLLTSLGRVELENGHEDAALDAFRRAVGQGGDVETVGTVIDLLASGGRDALAGAVFAGLPDTADPGGAARAARAELARRAGRLDEALRLVQDALAAAPASQEWHLILGDILRDRGETDAARDAYLAAADDPLPARIRVAMLPLPAKGVPTDEEVAVAVEALQALRSELGPSTALDAALGTALLRGDRANEAVEAFERVVHEMPWSAAAWLDLAEAWRRTDGPDAAVRSGDCAAEAARMRPFDREVVLAVARNAARNGDDSTVVLTTTIFLERTPSDVGVLRARAEARLRLGDLLAAAADLESVRERGDDGLVVRLELAEAYVRLGQLDDAWRLVSAAADPEERRALEIVLASHAVTASTAGRTYTSPVALAIGHARAGRPDQALAVLREAWAQDHGDPSVARALVLLLCGDEMAALPLEERLAEARAVADAADSLPSRGLAELVRGRIALAGGDAADAAEQLRRAARELPWDPAAHVLLGEALMTVGEGAAARDAFVRATWLPGGRAAFGTAIAERLTRIAQEEPDLGARERVLRDALRAAPATPLAPELLFDLLFARGAQREAAEVAERAMGARRASGTPQVELLKRALAARLEIGDAERAGRHLDALERAGGQLEHPETVRGLVSLGRGRNEEAVALFRAALDADGADRLAALGLSEALVRSGDADAAVAFVDARLDARPDELPLGYILARALVRRGRADAADAVTAGVLARAPLDPAALRHRVWLLGLLSRAAEALDVARDAARTARAAEDREVRSLAPEFDVLAAECLLQLKGRAKDALEETRRIAAVPETSSDVRLEARVVEAESLIALERPEEADAVIRGLMSTWEDGRPVTTADASVEPRVRFVKGMVLLARDQIGPATTEFLRAAQLDPLHHAASNNAAWCMVQSDPASPAALDLARRATTAYPEVATYWDTRAICERGSGMWTEALASWEHADEILVAGHGAPAERATILLRTAELLLDLDRKDEARDIARKLLEVAPNAPEAARAREIVSRS